MTERTESNIADMAAAALANRHHEPEQALYLAEVALAEARAEVARIERTWAEEKAKIARHAVEDPDRLRDIDDPSEKAKVRARDYQIFQLQRGVASGISEHELRKAEDTEALAETAREFIENQMPILAPEVVTKQ